jgi:hypothetical protein
MKRTDRHALKQALGGGAVAGIVAGTVLKLLLLSTAHGQYAQVLKGSAAPFLGAHAFNGSYALGPILLGLFCHYAISIGWGVLFGALLYGQSRGTTLAAGVAWGLVVWLVMSYLVLPMVGLGAMVASAPIGPAIFGHLIFGLTLAAAFLPFQEPSGVSQFMQRRSI